MGTKQRTGHKIKKAAVLFLVAALLRPSPAATQLRSAPHAVTLVATLPSSVSVHPQSIPTPLAFGESELARFEVIALVLRWHLRLGESFQIQFALDTEDDSQPLLSDGGFRTVEQLRLASVNNAFLPRAGASGPLLTTSVDSTDEWTGRAGILIGVVPPRLAESQTIRISVVVF